MTRLPKGALAIELSLFDDDPFRRVLTRIGLVRGGKIWFRLVIPLVFAVGWLIPFFLSALQGHLIDDVFSRAFLKDMNMPVQTAVAALLFLAEPFVDEHVRNAGMNFAKSGLLPQPEVYSEAARSVASLRRAVLPEILIAFLAIMFVATFALPVLLGQGHESWGVDMVAGRARYNLAGWWVVLSFAPLMQFLWIRWLWKVVIWFYFLNRISHAEMRIAVGHPDQCGGLRFIGHVQSAFGILIFGVGCMVAVDALRQVQEGVHAVTLIFSVAGFCIIAPLAFMAPLLLFTKQIYCAKQEGLLRYELLLTRFTNEFEEQYLPRVSGSPTPLPSPADLASLSGVQTMHAHVASMRIVPFDLESLGRLTLTAVGPMVPLIVRWIPWPGIRLFIEKFVAH